MFGKPESVRMAEAADRAIDRSRDLMASIRSAESKNNRDVELGIGQTVAEQFGKRKMNEDVKVVQEFNDLANAIDTMISDVRAVFSEIEQEAENLKQDFLERGKALTARIKQEIEIAASYRADLQAMASKHIENKQADNNGK